MFCASATLIESHEKRRKREKGLKGSERGRNAAALDAAGAALGSIALFAFAGTATLLLRREVSLTFACASLAWIVVAGVAWRLWHDWRR